MGKGVIPNMNVKNVKATHKTKKCNPALNSKSGALIRQKQLTKCQTVRTQVHPNRITNSTASKAGLLYRPKSKSNQPKSSLLKQSKAMATQRKNKLKKSLQVNNLSAITARIQKRSKPASSKLSPHSGSSSSASRAGTSSHVTPSSAASTSCRDAQTCMSDPLQTME